MSQYPYGYGQYLGGPVPPPPPNQYAYPNQVTYPPAPGYGAPHDPNAPAPNYYAMTQSAVGYYQNSNMPGIPGLGIAGTPAAGAPYQPPPALPAWGHQPQVNQEYPQFAAGTPNVPSQYHSGYSAPAQFNGPADQNYQPPTYNSIPHSLPPKPVAHLMTAVTQSSDEMEEGELSDGQFEDLYEPVDSSAKSKTTGVASNAPSMPDHSQPTSAVDTPSGGFYTNEEEDSDGRNQPFAGVGAIAGALPNNHNGPQTSTTVRERSGSYSPYLSPREIQGASTPNNTGRSYQNKQTPEFHVVPRLSSSNGHGQVPGLGQPADNAFDALTTSNGVSANKAATSQAPGTTGSIINNNNINHAASMPEFISLTEATKEAQKAILRLWPLGIKYQHYIDEGFDEKVVKRLFSELHLDMSTGKPIQPTQVPSQPLAPLESEEPAPATSTSPTKKPISLAQPQSITKPVEADKMDKSEERKDRIARLLAEKLSKGPAPAPVSAPTVAPPPPAQASAPAAVPVTAQITAQAKAPTQTAHAVPAAAQPTSAAFAMTNPTATAKSSATSTPTGPEKPKSKEGIERLLRQKMEALQKSREVGAQKVDSDKTSSAPVNTAAPDAAIPVPLQSTTAILGHPPMVKVTPVEQSSQDLGPIPGLFLSATPQAMQPVNIRKRPVAADFVDYSSASESHKRPFGQKRQNSSLVIDVSDASDDEDMDIDMDMDSPTETPLAIQRSNSQVPRGPSLAQFPPLRDLSRRNISSPVPSARTPPSGPIGAKDRVLLQKQKEIEDMKRKIAELEAKKKVKKGSQTPSQVASTPSEGNDSESSGAIAPRASSSSADKVDGPSAQLISEAVSANLPKPSEPLPKEDIRAQRDQSVSLARSRMDAAQEQNRKKLAALREAREAKKREHEARMREEEARRQEEEARMEEEEARLQAELDGEMDMDQGSEDEMNQSEHMSVDEQPAEEIPKDNGGKQDGNKQAAASPQVSMIEDQEKPASRAHGTNSETAEHLGAVGAVIEAHDAHASEAPGHVAEGPTSSEVGVEKNNAHDDEFQNPASTTAGGQPPSEANNNEELPSPPYQQAEDIQTADDVPVVEQAPESLMDPLAKEAVTTSDIPQGQYPFEPAEPVAKDSVDHVAIPDSPDFSPEPANGNSANGAAYVEAQISEQPVPATISDVPQSRGEHDEHEEIEGAVTGEPKQAPAPKPSSSFVPYESPLRYFRAFKFHPEFNKVVPGGVKSLTYSNKIDPVKQLCPSELEGGACQRGEACEYQHLNSIGVSDEQILVELGRSDDYTGEQKVRFINGLKELLQDFRAKQVRDFDAIAAGIIEFRARFLGDKSKVLPLEGVTL